MLTQRQRQLLQFIRQFMQTHGVPPSFDEMRGALNFRSKSGIHRLISGLEERGYLRRLPYRARALEIVRQPHEIAQAMEQPFASAAGGAAGSSNIVQGPFRRRRSPPKPELLPGGARQRRPAALRPDRRRRADRGHRREQFDRWTCPAPSSATASTMSCRSSATRWSTPASSTATWPSSSAVETAENGQIVVAFIDEDREVTLKRLRKRGASIALEPANPNYETRIFGPNQVRVQGRLVGLLRRY